MVNKHEIESRWKYFWMILSIVLFIGLIWGLVSHSVNKSNSCDEITKQCQDNLSSLQSTCNENIDELNNQWENAFNDLLNCYQNGLHNCNVIKPTLE